MVFASLYADAIQIGARIPARFGRDISIGTSFEFSQSLLQEAIYF